MTQSKPWPKCEVRRKNNPTDVWRYCTVGGMHTIELAHCLACPLPTMLAALETVERLMQQGPALAEWAGVKITPELAFKCVQEAIAAAKGGKP